MGNKDARRREIKKPKRRKLAREDVNQAVKQAAEGSQLYLAGVRVFSAGSHSTPSIPRTR